MMRRFTSAPKPWVRVATIISLVVGASTRRP